MIEDKIMVSVCCITYNQKDYIRDAIEGFLKQKTNFDYEIIIHDDASTDGTTEILKEYEERYPGKFRIIYEEENQYQKGSSFIRAMYEQAKGKYIAVCEGDDYWCDENKLQLQVDYMEQNQECSFCFHNAIIIDMLDGKKQKFVPHNKKSKKYLKKDNLYNVRRNRNARFYTNSFFYV